MELEGAVATGATDMNGATGMDGRWRMISRTGEYALRVVLLIASRPAGEWTSAGEAAARLGIPERYLARVLNELAREGTLLSLRGAHGGFRLAHAPGDLTLAAVVAPFDAVGDPPSCLIRPQRCGDGPPCIAHERWHKVATGVRDFFQTTTVAGILEAGRTSAPPGGDPSLVRLDSLLAPTKPGAEADGVRGGESGSGGGRRPSPQVRERRRPAPQPASPPTTGGMMPSIRRPLSGDILVFHLGEERERAADPSLLERSGRNARTLLKSGALRVTLVVIAPGGEIPEHSAAGPITVQPIEGRIRVHARGAVFDLGPEELLSADAGVPHRVTSDTGGAFLLTVGQPLEG